MNPLLDTWRFTRERLRQAHADLNESQLRWAPHANAHPIAEILLHVAGAEHYWAARLAGKDPHATDYEGRLDRAVIDGFLQQNDPPFGPADLTREAVDRALKFSAAELEPILLDPTPGALTMRLISPVGDDVSGYEGLTRLVQHAGYHTGQIWIYRLDPRFPTE